MLQQQKNGEELVTYLFALKNTFSKLKMVCERKNKTLKIKAFINIIDIVAARADGLYHYCKAGAVNEYSIVVQKSLYDPIIEYLVNELTE